MRRVIPITLLSWMVRLATVTQAQEPTSQPAPSSSYLNTSFEATESLDRAAKLAASKQWDSAAKTMQNAGEKFGEYLVATDERRHVCIREFVNERVSQWPPEGLAAYRASFDGAARSALKSAMLESDEEALIRVSDRYFATHAGAAALDEAGERAIERGAFMSARRWYLKLAEQHPDRTIQTDGTATSRIANGRAWAAKAALCNTFEGDESSLRALIGALEDEKSEGTVAWGGRDQPLVEFLRGALAEATNNSAKPGRNEPIASATPMLGVTANRRGFSVSSSVAEARLWKFNSFGRAWWEDELSGYESQSARKDAWMRMLQSGRMLACVPVAGPPSGDPAEPPWVFVHDSRSVWAIDPLRPDRPAWSYDHPGTTTARPSWNAEDEPPLQFTSLLADGHLYVHLDIEQPVTASGQTLISSVLLCLDAKTGAVLWQNKLDGFSTAFEDTRLDGAPVLHEGRLFALARRRKPFGFEACNLLRFDVETGKLIWTVHLGEAATGSYGYHRPTLTHPAANGDLVFVQSNLGTVSAVSVDTGRVVWLTQYESKFADAPEGFWPSRMGRPTRSWQYPAAVTCRDAVIVMPLDSDSLMVLNSNNGRELFRVGLEALDNPEQIIGARGDLIYLAGSQVTCYDLSVHSRVWQRPLDHGQLFGRAALTTNGVFVPTSRALLTYPLNGGPATSYKWSLEEAGNLAMLSDQIVVASATSVFALSGKEAAFAQLGRRMEQSLEDAAIPLALAELAFSTGENERGMAAVEEAIRRAGGFARLTDDAVRRRFFASLTRFTSMVMTPDEDIVSHQSDSGGAEVESALRLLSWAAQCAPDATGQAAYRLQLARTQLVRRNIVAAASVYQQIMSDRSLRGVRMKVVGDLSPPGYRQSGEALEDDSDEEIGPVVTRWIAWLIATHGDEVYAAIEKAARDRLTVVRATKDASGLLELADAYPNSKVATIALGDHARVMMEQGDLATASRSYRRALAQVNAQDRPELIREFASCLAKDRKWALAAQWVERGRRDYPQHRFSLEGQRIDFTTYGRLLIGEHDVRDAACAMGEWPVKESFKRLYPERISVLDPVFTHLARTQWDAFVTYCGGQIEARHPESCSAQWSRPVPCATQPQLLGMDEYRYFFATNHRLFALTRTSGQQAWSVGEEPNDDPDEDPESNETWTCHALSATKLVSSTDRGELICMDTNTGAVQWRKQADAHTNNQIVVNEKFVCYATWQGRQHAIVILDAVTGETIADARPEEDWPVQGLAMMPHGALLVLFSNAIHVMDPANGKSLWRVGTGDRFVPATMIVDEEGLFISADGRRLTKYDPLSGRVCWTTPPISNGSTDGFWCQASDGVIYSTCGEQLTAFDTADGRSLWSLRMKSGMRVDVPRLTRESILVTLVEKRASEKKESAKAEGAKSYRIVRYQRTDGEQADMIDAGDLVTPVLHSFGGVYVRDRSTIILDGNQLFGYGPSK